MEGKASITKSRSPLPSVSEANDPSSHFQKKKPMTLKKMTLPLVGLVLASTLAFATIATSAELPFRQALNDFLDDLLNHLQAYNNRLPEDRVYAHFDKTLYKPGETTWFTAYVRDGQSLKKSEQSDIVKVELYNPKGAIAQEYKIIAENGVAKGDFKIDENAVGGIYKVKVYTNWMKNDTEPAIFIKELTVQKVVLPRLKMKLDLMKKAYGAGDEVVAELVVNDNTNQPLANTAMDFVVKIAGADFKKGSFTTNAKGEAMVKFSLPETLTTNDGLLNIMIPYQGQTESISRSVPIVLNNIQLKMYPEGGDLVNGLASKVAFKALNEFGKPADIEGIVTDSKGNTLTSFASYHQGMGVFGITPQADETYIVKITKPVGVTQTFELPEAMPAGHVLAIREVTEKQVYLSIKSSHADELYLVATVRGKKHFATKINVKEGETKTSVPTRYFPIGVAQFTLFDSKGIERAERLAFVNKHQQLNISIKTNKEKYQPREKVRMTIKVTDERGMPMPANLSVAVVDDQLLAFADDKSSNILSWMLMEADIRGKVEDPNFYFDPKEEKADQALDYLLMTAGWRRFVWKDIREGKTPPIAHANEQAMIKGLVLDVYSRKPIANTKVMLNNEFQTVTDKEGRYAIKGDVVAAATIVLTFQHTDYNHQGLRVYQLGEQRPMYLYETPRPRPTAAIRKNKNAVPPAPAAPRIMVEDEIADIDEEIEQEIPRVAPPPPPPPPVEEVLDEEEEIEEAAPLPVAMQKVQAERQKEVQRVAKRQAKQGEARRKMPKDEAVNNAQLKAAEAQRRAAEQAVKAKVADNRINDKKDAAFGDEPVVAGYMIFPAPDRSNYYRAREFSGPTYDKEHDKDEPIEKRTDFRSTVYWNGNVEMDRKGKAVVEFYNSDAVTSFKVTAEGFAADGAVGRAEHRYYTQMPFSLSAKLPVEVLTQDIIKIPLTLVNNTRKTISGNLQINYPKGLTPKGDLPTSATLKPKEARTQYLTFEVTERGAADRISIAFSSGAFSDAIEKSLRIISKGFPASIAFSDEAMRQTHTFKVENIVKGSLEANVKAYPSAISNVLSGLEAMLRQPYGCFEQTSSSTYPNILVLNYLQETNQANSAISARAKELIDKGYKRLAGYESASGGFEWFGGDPGHEGLTAYGLMEFIDMQKVYDGVDAAMIQRTTEWLMSRRDGTGKFKRNPRALHQFGLTDNETMSIYITWALSEANFEDIQTEVDFAYAQSIKTNDPYQLGLATNILFNRGDEQRGQKLLAALLNIQADEGGWAHGSSQRSAPGSSGNALRIETAGLAALAIMKSKNPDRNALNKCMDFIKSSRGSFGGYASTNSTVLALRALVAFAKFSKRTDEAGTIEVYANGKKVQSFDYPKGYDEPIVLDGIAPFLTEGSNDIEVKYANTNTPLPYTVAVHYNTFLPNSSNECVVQLATKVATPTVKVGETVRLTATLTNTTNEGQPMTMAIVGLPAGLTAQPWQLKELLDKKVYDFYEVIGNNLVFYYRQMKPSEEKIIYLDLKADIAGNFDAPASSAYLYYTDEHKYWTALERVSVKE